MCRVGVLCGVCECGLMFTNVFNENNMTGLKVLKVEITDPLVNIFPLGLVSKRQLFTALVQFFYNHLNR